MDTALKVKKTSVRVVSEEERKVWQQFLSAPISKKPRGHHSLGMLTYAFPGNSFYRSI